LRRVLLQRNIKLGAAKEWQRLEPGLCG